MLYIIAVYPLRGSIKQVPGTGWIKGFTRLQTSVNSRKVDINTQGTIYHEVSNSSCKQWYKSVLHNYSIE